MYDNNVVLRYVQRIVEGMASKAWKNLINFDKILGTYES